jgi:hypothetical protein
MNREIFDAVNNAIKSTQKYDLVMGSLSKVPGRGYFTEDWLPGTVALDKESARRWRAIRYNMALQAIEVRDSSADRGVRVLPINEVASFTLGPANRPSSRLFQAHNYINSYTSGDRSFFEALTPGGEVQLFILHRIVKKPAARATSATQMLATEQLYMRETSLYLLRPGQKTLSEFMPNRKSVLKLFASRTQEMQEFISSKGLRYESLQDVLTMTQHYNKLVASA